MKKIVFGILALCSLVGFSQDGSRWNVSMEVENNHIWRGLAIADKPSVNTNVSVDLAKDGSFKAGFWGGVGVANETSGRHYREMDIYLQYQKGGFSAALWDLYNATDFAHGSSQADVFNYNLKTTGHILDLRLGYFFGEQTPISLEADIWLTGSGDRELEIKSLNEIDQYQRFSTYFQVAYDANAGAGVVVSPFVGAGFALNGETHVYGDGLNSFDIVNVGLKVAKKVNLGSHTIPVKATAFYNPSTKISRLNLSLGIF